MPRAVCEIPLGKAPRTRSQVSKENQRAKSKKFQGDVSRYLAPCAAPLNVSAFHDLRSSALSPRHHEEADGTREAGRRTSREVIAEAAQRP